MKYFDYLNVTEHQFQRLLLSNNFACDAPARQFFADSIQVLKPRPIEWSCGLLRAAERLGGLIPGETFEYPNAQGSTSTALVVSLYDLPEDMVNPYLYCFSGVMYAPIYAFEALRFFAKKTGFVLPFISSGKESNKGLFNSLFHRDNGLIRGTEYDSYYRIMAELADRNWVYQNYTKCDDDSTAGNLVELYNFAKSQKLGEVTFVLISGNPHYDKRLLSEWMWQLKQPKFADVKINLVLAHCPMRYTFNTKEIPEARIGHEIAMGYVAAALGPLYKDTISFDGQTTSEHPERYLMPGVADANWEKFRNLIMYHSSMGWPDYQELLYGISHEEAVENVILADLFARASFTPADYDAGIGMMLHDYKRFLDCDGAANFEEYLQKTTDDKFF